MATTTAAPLPTTSLSLDEIELGNPDTMLRDDVDGIFLKLRSERPIGFDREFPAAGLPPGPGFWSLTRHRDVARVNSDWETFSNLPAVGIPTYPTRQSLISMDPPVHTKFRLIVNRGFTPRMIGRLKQQVWDDSRRVVRAAAERARDAGDPEVDFVEEIARRLPTMVIAALLGMPAEDHELIYHLTNAFIGPSDPEYGGTVEKMLEADRAMEEYALRLGEDRRGRPGEDLTSIIVNASITGPDGTKERVSDQEFAEFVKLLMIGGNETTRNAIAHGVVLFDRHPEQRETLLSDPERYATTAADEIVRYATPITLMRRTATRDTSVGGVDIREGDKVVMWYRAANFDEESIEDPYRFDITRSPNDHVGFGAGGPHFCLGASLARLEIGAMLATVAEELPRLEVTGPPAKLRTLSGHGVKHLPVRLGV
ncbi:MAG TPA: cytochrome P450 [Acidimicrobiales bacterium]|nr:cytochrome P450 [Acidimicrobiales bacterium]